MASYHSGLRELQDSQDNRRRKIKRGKKLITRKRIKIKKKE